jgi:ribosomal protein L32
VAVPKKRTTRTIQGQRRSHLALTATQLVRTSSGAVVPRRLKKAAELGLLKTAKKV